MKLGTRGSKLALAQAGWVADRLAEALGAPVELVPITTTGDRDRALPDKEKWVRELELALLDGRVDLAVHSAKDVPAHLPAGLALVGAPERGDPRDVLVGELSGRVGTASPRRAAQLRALDLSLEVVEVRGNVDTRLKKLADGEVDGLVLAAAGLDRLGRSEVVARTLDELVPAAGQGTLAVEGRMGVELPDGFLHGPTWAALQAERACVRALDADCHTPVGAHYAGGALRAWVGAEDGSAWVTDSVAGEADDALGEQVAARLLAAGAAEVLGR